MIQLDLHSAREENRRIRRKMAIKHEYFIDKARETAKMLIRQDGSTTMDKVRWHLELQGVFPYHHNACGPVFQHPDFEPCGFAPSALRSRRGGMVRVWRLKK